MGRTSLGDSNKDEDACNSEGEEEDADTSFNVLLDSLPWCVLLDKYNDVWEEKAFDPRDTDEMANNIVTNAMNLDMMDSS